MILPRRKFYAYLALATLLGQLLGLVFCGDADCLEGGSEENCATLLCSLLARHSPSTAGTSSGANDSCQCFCHQLIYSPGINSQITASAVTRLHVIEISHFFAAPVRDIDHPPCL